MSGKPGRSGGARPGAGRPKKPPTLLNICASTDPLVFLTAVMNDPGADARLRADAAKALLPYVHIRKGEGIKDQKQDAAKKASTGKFAPSAPPRLVSSK